MRKQRKSLVNMVAGFEASVILKTIDEFRGDRYAAAEVLGISIATLYRKLPARAEGSLAENGRRVARVYLMVNASAKAYKIGFSMNPRAREKTLMAIDPELHMVRTYEGTRADERALHVLFAEKRLRGEWFKLDESDLKRVDEFFAP